jgi:hypothetical protein
LFQFSGIHTLKLRNQSPIANRRIGTSEGLPIANCRLPIRGSRDGSVQLAGQSGPGLQSPIANRQSAISQ